MSGNVTWASLRAQESRLSQGGLQGNSVVLGNYTTEQPETNRTIEAYIHTYNRHYTLHSSFLT